MDGQDISIIVYVGGFLIIFFWPTILASRKGHPNVGSVFLLNCMVPLSFGFGWIALFISVLHTRGRRRY